MNTPCLTHLSLAGGTEAVSLLQTVSILLMPPGVHTRVWNFWPVIPRAVNCTGDFQVAPRNAGSTSPQSTGHENCLPPALTFSLTSNIASLFFLILNNLMGGGGARCQECSRFVIPWLSRPRDYNTAKGAGARFKKTDTQFQRVALGGTSPLGLTPHCPTLYFHKAEQHKGLRSWEDGGAPGGSGTFSRQLISLSAHQFPQLSKADNNSRPCRACKD